jgi:hypothetical protein
MGRHTQSDDAAVPPPCDTLRDLRVDVCEMTYDEAVQLATVAGRLRVLRLER